MKNYSVKEWWMQYDTGRTKVDDINIDQVLKMVSTACFDTLHPFILLNRIMLIVARSKLII